jgi:uncharacterized protein with ATP-grasp and redox domains
MKDPATLPPPLMTSEPDSFARQTITQRAPQIVQQIITDHAYPAESVSDLERLRREIENGDQPRALCEQASDVAFWQRQLKRHAGAVWLALPWYFAETYFYRRILEAVRYNQPGPWQGRDPFEHQKAREIGHAVEQLAQGWEELVGLPPAEAFTVLLHSSLWGNRVDLSNRTIRTMATHGLATTDERKNIVVDHTEAVHDLLAAGVRRVSFINDNVGLDLLFDLVLSDFLLAHGWSQHVVLNLKGEPFYVSDAMIKDVKATLDELDGAGTSNLRQLGSRLHRWREQKRLILQTDPFWTTCLSFRQMPATLTSDLTTADLVILKGDVNYRRLLSDRHWPHTARLERIAAYFPHPFVTLRTLKGEIMVGLEPGQAARLEAEDSTWLINGQRGIVHFVGA